MKDLFRVAKAYDIQIEYTRLPHDESLSTQVNEEYIVLMDYALIHKQAAERVHAAHELGHCITGSFYNLYAPLDVRKKHENIANRWAIKKLVPLSLLLKALKHGIVEVWELAEAFDVTEDFMRKAVEYYKEEAYI